MIFGKTKTKMVKRTLHPLPLVLIFTLYPAQVTTERLLPTITRAPITRRAKSVAGSVSANCNSVMSTGMTNPSGTKTIQASRSQNRVLVLVLDVVEDGPAGRLEDPFRPDLKQSRWERA